MADTPERIDRAALDRIIRRATELQTSERDIGEGLTEPEVVSLGQDVGIPPRYLRQAMLEERMSGPRETHSGLLARLVGSRTASAERVIAGSQDAVERALLGWVDANELFTVQRQLPGRITWEVLGGVQAALRRGSAMLQRKGPRFMLQKADLLVAAVTSLEEGFCHVRLEANLGRARGGVIGGAAAVGSIGASGSIVLFTLGALPVVAALPLPIAAVIMWTVLRTWPPVHARTQLGLERALDFLERGGVKPAHALPPERQGLLEQLATEVRKAIQSGSGRKDGT